MIFYLKDYPRKNSKRHYKKEHIVRDFRDIIESINNKSFQYKEHDLTDKEYYIRRYLYENWLRKDV